MLLDDHFSIAGTLIEAWASMTSFQPKDGSFEPAEGRRNGERDFHRETRSNDTQGSRPGGKAVPGRDVRDQHHRARIGRG